MNNLFIQGRIGQEVEIKNIGNSKLATTRFAVSKYNKDNPSEPLTDWYTLNAWDKSVEALRYMRKGDLIVVHGRIEIRKYTTKEGEERYDPTITVFRAFGPKKWRDASELNESTQQSGGDQWEKKGNDLPF